MSAAHTCPSSGNASSENNATRRPVGKSDGLPGRSSRPFSFSRAALPATIIMLILGAALPAAGASLDVDALIARQAKIGHGIAQVARGMDAENPTEARIRSVLYTLSVTECANAIAALEKIARAQTPEAAQEKMQALGAAQDRTIEILERILGIIAQLKEENREPADAQKGSDLPQDVRDKLRDLAKALDEFQEEQKKAVVDTASLAKTPVEDFTPEQEEQLKQLEATEQEWAKFLKDAHSDLSKLPEQDFSNPAMLKELVEIYTEIEMAADALSKKAVEIAVPYEQAGAELAETLEANLERWLDDQPDRLRWQMEEPLGDYDVPMADLPAELQDIVGDLMEEEEDLMEDIEDASSSWADSADKGAGWTAMDGPISNMSAKGITGNTLPNSSEIGGRSGEGRTGKSAGEFVEDTAVGKGGRRTPTRLTPDPFEKGVVNDKSPDSGGGSTGGGKISGAGGEGLEGPVPPEIAQQLQALAGRQAELRNRAERIELKFKAMHYSTEPIVQTIGLMENMEDALRNARMGQVTRTQHLMLRSMQDAQAFMSGELRVQRDQSVNLPPELQEQIMDAMDDPSPRQYEGLLRAYFEKVARAE